MNFQIPDNSPWLELNKNNDVLIEDRVSFQLIDAAGHGVSSPALGLLEVEQDGLYQQIKLLSNVGFDYSEMSGIPVTAIMTDSRGIIATVDIPQELRISGDKGKLIISAGKIATCQGVKTVTLC